MNKRGRDQTMGATCAIEKSKRDIVEWEIYVDTLL